MLKISVATSFLAMSCTAASAAGDLLPLRQGIYVAADVACNQLNNAVTMSYWGDELNSQRAVGSIRGVEEDGGQYRLTIELSHGDGDPEMMEMVLRIPDAQTFVFEEPAPATAYRWCFDRMP